MFRCVILAICCLLSPLLTADTDTGPFQEALNAARNDDWETLARQQKRLGDDHPLQAYLDFHRLRAALPHLSPERVNDYAQRYPDSPLPQDIRQLATVAYGKAQDWQALLAINSKPPRSLSLRCYYHQAQLENDRDAALQAAAKIWHSGHSRPSNCDAIFEHARQAGVIDDKAIWERQNLAFLARQPGLMRYLGQKLNDTAYATASDTLQTLYQKPETLDAIPDSLPEGRQQRLRAMALYRWAYKDTVAARQWYQQHGDRLADDTHREKTVRRLAWYSTIRGIEENRAWLDNWLEHHADETLLSQRARRSVIQQDWPAANHWISRLPTDEQQDSRWLYWQARALEAMGKDDQARKHLQQAAQQRNFFGFLAADQLGEPYRFQQAKNQTAALKKQPGALTRIRLLRDMGEDRASRDEWQWLLWHSETPKVNALAQYALEQKWYGMAVQASIQGKAWDALAWRFPPAHLSGFRDQARDHDLDPWLAMAVARRESAFKPHARSPVGARGLMQLMPATARKVAQDKNMKAPSGEQLYQPRTNIALGSHYLAQLLDRFDGNRVLALAAYNAGPHRVNAWLSEREDEVPADIWIESIPFRETRAYVQAVLTYRALFVGLHDGQPRSDQLLTQQESTTPYSLSLLE